MDNELKDLQVDELRIKRDEGEVARQILQITIREKEMQVEQRMIEAEGLSTKLNSYEDELKLKTNQMQMLQAAQKMANER